VPPRQRKPEPEKSLEATLWEAADRLRSRVDAAEYKHVVLGLIFLKYVSDVFAKRREQLRRLVDDPDSDYFMPTDEAKAAVLEDRDEYASEGVFWMPEGHRWDDLRKAAKQPDIGTRIDAAMEAIEKENPSLRGVLPNRYARRELTPAMLGGLIDTFSRKDLAGEEHKGLDVLGRVYEYFLGRFASAEGKLGGEFYTPRSVVRLMVEMLEPFDGRVFDPACGSGGMFVQAEQFVEAHG
jgi:type I restriction enzyme M protein